MKLKLVIDTSGSMEEEPKPAILSLCMTVIEQSDDVDAEVINLDSKDAGHFVDALDAQCPVLIFSDGGFPKPDEADGADGAKEKGKMAAAIAIGADADVFRLGQLVGSGNVFLPEKLLDALDALNGGSL